MCSKCDGGKVQLAGDVENASRRFRASIDCRKKKKSTGRNYIKLFFNESEIQFLREIPKIKISRKSYISRSYFIYLKRVWENIQYISKKKKRLFISFKKIYQYFNFNLFNATFPSATASLNLRNTKTQDNAGHNAARDLPQKGGVEGVPKWIRSTLSAE